MANVEIDQSVVSLREFFASSTRFFIPPYQRDYSWDEEELRELWADIEELEEDSERKYHYLGYIVVSPSPGSVQDANSPLDIIDGQQRIATLSFLVRAVMQCLKDLEDRQIDAEDNASRRREFDAKYLRNLDPVTMESNARLKLNRNNDQFYVENILEFKERVGNEKPRPSDKLMWNALNFFYTRLKKKFVDPESPDAGTRIADFASNLIMEKLVLTRTAIRDQSNAYQLFETLNYRGKDLSPSDLVKNLLFQEAAKQTEEKLAYMEEQWNEIVRLIGQDRITTFFRQWTSSTSGTLVRAKALYRHIRKEITSQKSGYSFTYVSNAKKQAKVYRALLNPPDWKEIDKSSNLKQDREVLDALTIFDSKQHMPLLLAAAECLDGKDFSQCLLWIETIAFRHSIIAQRRPSDLERAYIRAVDALRKGQGFEAAKKILREIYVDNADFTSLFTNVVLKTATKKKLIRYILGKLELATGSEAVNPEHSKTTIEHILPQQPSPSARKGFEQAMIEIYIARLGNYCLLDKGRNIKASNNSFEMKKEIYKKSRFELTKQILKYPEWTSQTLFERQQYMAELAVNIWNIDTIDSAKRRARA